MSIKMIALILLLDLIQSPVLGLRCWTCENEPNIEACDKNAVLKTCRFNEQSCHTVARRIGTPDNMFTVSRHCKQKLACLNDQAQNGFPMPGFKMPRHPQCNGDQHSAVCRCCCTSDGCNRGALSCIPEPRCPMLKKPKYGDLVCTNENKVGSVCRTVCGLDYYVSPNEADVRTCTESGTWEGIKSCCARPCPPNGNLDVVFVLHTSDSGNWKTGLDVIATIQSLFKMGKDSARVGFVGDIGHPYESTAMHLNDFSERASLSLAIRSQAFNNTGNAASNIAEVLKYVKRSMFTTRNGDRKNAENIIVLVTDQNNSAGGMTSAAYELRRSGIKTFVVNFQEPKSNKDLRNLLPLTRYMNRIFSWKPGMSNRTFAFRVGVALCGNPC
ncbi:uncharacterized protein LOC100184956 [Ciona intestinalis]